MARRFSPISAKHAPKRNVLRKINLNAEQFFLYALFSTRFLPLVLNRVCKNGKLTSEDKPVVIKRSEEDLKPHFSPVTNSTLNYGQSIVKLKYNNRRSSKNHHLLRKTRRFSPKSIDSPHSRAARFIPIYATYWFVKQSYLLEQRIN